MIAAQHQTEQLSFETISFVGDKAKYITPSWNELDTLTLQIAARIKQVGVQLDLIVALAKGAWPMSRSLVDYTQIKELASLGVKFYKGINERLGEPTIYQQLPVSVKGKNILLFDDVADTGESLQFAKAYLLEQGAAMVQTATLLYKPWSVIDPDYYGALTEAWIIFPFERREMIALLGKSWREQGIDQEEIEARYQQLGFKEVYRSVC